MGDLAADSKTLDDDEAHFGAPKQVVPHDEKTCLYCPKTTRQLWH
ncbi:hypothetical protein PSH55_22465 [Pseudoalteromonas sp. Angola-31]|nr:hypothetical protein [Pseudoalteromonas sp. Angola-31]